MPGLIQVLYYGTDGSLQSAVARWEGKTKISADQNSALQALPLQGTEIQAIPGGDTLSVRTSVPLQMQFTSGQGMPMVAGMELGEPLPKDPNRPSLIIRRADQSGLWNIAKASGSAVEAIRNANGLDGDPVPGQLLLIPVK